MATHSIILAWETPWTEESGRTQSMGSIYGPMSDERLFDNSENIKTPAPRNI